MTNKKRFIYRYNSNHTDKTTRVGIDAENREQADKTAKAHASSMQCTAEYVCELPIFHR